MFLALIVTSLYIYSFCTYSSISSFVMSPLIYSFLATSCLHVDFKVGLNSFSFLAFGSIAFHSSSIPFFNSVVPWPFHFSLLQTYIVWYKDNCIPRLTNIYKGLLSPPTYSKVLISYLKDGIFQMFLILFNIITYREIWKMDVDIFCKYPSFLWQGRMMYQLSYFIPLHLLIEHESVRSKCKGLLFD